MGSDPAPFFANLFLYHYESSWIKLIKKTNPVLARKFGNTFRYIDDLLAANDGNSFESFYRDIYPEELELGKENSTCSETNFLDLNIFIKNGVFSTKLYDKRDYFDFDIVRLPHRSSNIPSKMFYASIAAECLRICRATSSLDMVLSSVASLLTRMTKQGGQRTTMKMYIKRTLNKHKIYIKFNTSNEILIDRLFA